MTNQATLVEDRILNGLNTSEYERTLDAVRNEPAMANFRFRASNVWIGGGLNRSTIGSFYGAGAEQGAEDRRFAVDAGEPPVLLGADEAPNPVEYVLHALAACLTSSIVYKATARGVAVRSIRATLEGDLDARAFLDLSDAKRKGYETIRATYEVDADASAEEIKALAEYSPVLDVLSHGTSVDLRVEKR